MRGANTIKYNVKLIIAGDVVEVYRYEKAIRTGKDGSQSKQSEGHGTVKMNCESEERQMRDEKNLKDSLRRTKQTLRRTINANIGKWGERDKFFTLTFAENMTNQEETNRLFRSFIKKLSYKIFKKESGLKYVCVVERQQRGAIHYHLVVFNMPFVPVEELSDVWGHGFVRINTIEGNDNVGAYVVKYMGKTAEMDAEKSAKEKNKKLYFTSRGLDKPSEFSDGTKKGKEMIETFTKEMENFMVFSGEFENEHVGKMSYEQYNMNRQNDC